MTNTIERGDIEHVLDSAGIDWNDLDDTYSGRGMYGDRCLSFTIAGKRIQRDLCRFMVELGMSVDLDYVTSDVASRLAAAVCTDDLGLDMIVYFPGWKLSD